MVGGVGMGSVSSGGGGEGFDGGASKAWVNTNFVSIEFFGRLFKAYGPGENQGDPDVEVLPNDMDSTISNIEAMFGFWTDFYLTALGNGGEIGASIYLAGLADVNVAGVQSGQVLTWNSAQNKWVATTPSSGVDMSVVWNALAAETSQQINASHLATALTGYATQTWVGQQGYLTSTDINDMATETWVGQHYLPLTGGTLTGALQVNATIFGYNYTNSNNAAAFIFDKPGNNYTGIGANAVSDQIYFGACDQNGAWISNYAQKWYFNGSIQSSGSLQAESVKIEQTNEINSYSGMLHLNYRVDTNMSLCNGGGSVGIGTSNPSYRLHVDGVIYSTTGVYSAGYVTALSDEREKNIIEEFEIPLDFIAKAPIVSYEWKDKERRGDKQHIGSIAQYWLREMPELVPEVNGRYTMDYGRIALLSAILTARHVVNLEQRIAELEKTLRGE